MMNSQISDDAVRTTITTGTLTTVFEGICPPAAAQIAILQRQIAEHYKLQGDLGYAIAALEEADEELGTERIKNAIQRLKAHVGYKSG